MKDGPPFRGECGGLVILGGPSVAAGFLSQAFANAATPFSMHSNGAHGGSRAVIQVSRAGVDVASGENNARQRLVRMQTGQPLLMRWGKETL